MICPWYVSAHAVRQWQAIEPGAPRDFDDASDRLLELCARVWHERYASGEREPRRTRTGALLYETGRADGRIRLVVSPAEARVHGGKSQVVDVITRTG